MGVLVKNNAYSTLASGITNVATTITVAAATGARFPAAGGADYFYATLIDTSNNLEVVKVTARTTDTLTVVRAQDGTTGRAYTSGDRIELRVCAALLADIRDSITPADGTVSTAKIVDGAVTAVKLASDAVTSVKILDANVLTAKIADSAVTAVKIASNAVTTVKILDANVTTAKIADANITAAKMSGAQSGAAPVFGARAWVTFTGGASPVISASGNIASVVRASAGVFTITFSAAMQDANYAIAGAAKRSSAAARGTHVEFDPTHTTTASVFRIRVIAVDTDPTPTDSTTVTVVVFR